MKSIYPITYPPRLKYAKDYNKGLKASPEPAENSKKAEEKKGGDKNELHYTLDYIQIIVFGHPNLW